MNFALLSMSGANLLMDSQMKVALMMFEANPVLMFISTVLFFGGFAMIAFGGNVPSAQSFKHKRILRQIAKNERKRQEALRKQDERLNR